MRNLPADDEANATPIPNQPTEQSDETIHLNHRRAEQLDPVYIPEPDEENADLKPFEPIGNYGKTESPSSVDGSRPRTSTDDGKDIQAGDDEDAYHPATPQTR